MFANYSYEQTRVSEINAAFCDPILLARNPFLRDSLLLSGADCGFGTGTSTEINPLTGPTSHSGDRQWRAGAENQQGRAQPRVQHRGPADFPDDGQARFSASFDVAGLGGNTNFPKPTLEGVWFKKAERPDDAWHAGAGRLHPATAARFFCRSSRSCSPSAASTACEGSTFAPSIGPRDPITGIVLGGNKTLLFNVEQIITIAGPVRLHSVLRCGPGARDRPALLVDRRPYCAACGGLPLCSIRLRTPA